MHADLDLGKVHPGIDVYDLRGDKVGTVAHVYRHPPSATLEPGTQPREEVVEVKTGPLGLGKHLYIPLRAIDTLTDAGDCLALNIEKGDLDPSWGSRPEYLGELTA